MENIKIKEFDFDKASEREWQIFYSMLKPIYSEVFPDEKEVSIDDCKGWFSGQPEVFKNYNVAVMNEDESKMLARVTMNYRNEPGGIENPYVWVDVSREYRRRGFAKKLLKSVVEKALEIGCKSLIFNSFSTVSAGDEFARKLQMNLGNSYSSSRLYMKDVDRELMKSWRDRLYERTGDFEIGFWLHPYPEEDIERFVTMENDFWASCPTGDLDAKPPVVTSEELRQRMEGFRKKNKQRPTVFAKHKKTGVFAGYTDVIADLNRKKELMQFGTGVLEKFRNLGIGRALKGEMTLKLLELYPEAEFIETSNAKINRSMLNINREMGYKHARTMNQWQITVEKLKEILENR